MECSIILRYFIQQLNYFPMKYLIRNYINEYFQKTSKNRKKLTDEPLLEI